MEGLFATLHSLDEVGLFPKGTSVVTTRHLISTVLLWPVFDCKFLQKLSLEDTEIPARSTGDFGPAGYQLAYALIF